METFAPPDLFGAGPGPKKRRGKVNTRTGERPQTAPSSSSNKRGATDDLEDEAEKGARVSAKRSPPRLDDERSSRRQAVKPFFGACGRCFSIFVCEVARARTLPKTRAWCDDFRTARTRCVGW